jgi:hypothetical protein
MCKFVSLFSLSSLQNHKLKVMHKILLVNYILLGVLCSCSSTQPDYQKASTKGISVDNSDEFLKLFTEIKGDTIHVFYQEFTDPSNDKFKGRQMDPKFYNFIYDYDSLFENEIKEDYHFFTCFKIRLSSNETGLLIRMPSQYSESAIDLFIWDNQKRKIVNSSQLSDGFGDEGWHFVREGWLVDVNKDGLPDIITREKDIDYGMEDDSTQQITHAEVFPSNIPDKDSFSVLISKGYDFKLSNYPIDTSKFQIKNWQ